MSRQTTASIASQEVAHFSSKAAEWWRNDGTFQQLHRINPLRIEYIRRQILTLSGRSTLKNIRVLDIGCGGGLVAESLTKLGAKVTGIDASPETIHIAASHANAEGLSIDYKVGSIETLAQTKARFDVVIALEVVEHVADRASFLRAFHRLLRPKGLVIMATINRTKKSYLLSILMAEYILNWVAVGTHDWEKLIRPSELVSDLNKAGFATTDLTGIAYSFLRQEFILNSHALDVNYLLTAKRD
jgi:2-polyprenyl-6-hydroxyphenyl methylase/3-demethylubiquinone-9 3-methyltransferase